MRILSLLLICSILAKCKIIIEDANMAALSRDDIGMIFYIALHNTDNCGYNVTARMVKCVEEVDLNDKDCEIMQLIGGDMGYLKPKCSKNITLLYPNMSLHNRKGYCIIAIKFISTDNQMLEKRTNITFNTLVSKYRPIPPVLRGYYEKRQITPCDSADLDPLKGCEPIDCHWKYLGTRSFFNKKWKRCQKVPKCIFDTEKHLPDVGYTPVTNRCLDLERSIRKSELAPLENKFSELSGESNKFSALLTNINCHYGKINNATGECDCLEGWSTAPFEKQPSLFVVHMCNIEKVSWYDSNRSMVTFVAFFISIAAVAVAMVVVLVSFILYHLYKCLKSFEAARKPCDCEDLETGKPKKPKDKDKPKIDKEINATHQVKPGKDVKKAKEELKVKLPDKQKEKQKTRCLPFKKKDAQKSPKSKDTFKSKDSGKSKGSAKTISKASIKSEESTKSKDSIRSKNSAVKEQLNKSKDSVTRSRGSTVKSKTPSFLSSDTSSSFRK